MRVASVTLALLLGLGGCAGPARGAAHAGGAGRGGRRRRQRELGGWRADRATTTPPLRNGLSRGGFITAAVGLAAIVAAGGWMAAAVACNADPDCAETETCREVPAPPGGVPYKQCVPRQ